MNQRKVCSTLAAGEANEAESFPPRSHSVEGVEWTVIRDFHGLRCFLMQVGRRQSSPISLQYVCEQRVASIAALPTSKFDSILTCKLLGAASCKVL